MNMKIAYALLGVIFAAMAMIVYSQLRFGEDASTEPVARTESLGPPESVAPDSTTASGEPPAALREADLPPVADSGQTAPASRDREESLSAGEIAAALEKARANAERVRPPSHTAMQSREDSETPAAPATSASDDASGGARIAQAPQPQPAPASPAQPAPAPQRPAQIEQTSQPPTQAQQTPPAPAPAPAETQTGTDPKPEPEPKTKAELAASLSNPAPGYAPVKPEELDHVNTLRQVQVETRDGDVVLRLKADKPFGRYKYFRLATPARLVVDLIGDWTQRSPGVSTPDNEAVKGVRFGRHQKKLRIVADLTDNDVVEPTVVNTPGDELIITFKGVR